MSDTPVVFISYASPDRHRATELYDSLTQAGFDVWLDVKQLKGGQDWDFEIKRALSKAAMVVVLLSANSVDRRGYAQREIKIALDKALDRLTDDIYVIPILLDDVPIPEQLKSIQAIHGEAGDCEAQLIDAIRHQSDRLGIETERVQVESNLRWSHSTYRDSWDGLPGYEIEFQLLKLSSNENPHVAEITDVIRGWLMSRVMGERTTKFGQMPDSYNFGDSRSFRQNSWDASCGEPKIKERVISISYSVWWYGAKAAHPNQFFHTFAFTLDPVTQITTLESVFEDRDVALATIRDEARRQLLGKEFEEMTATGESLKLAENFVLSGTEEWQDYHNFVFGPDGIELQFSCYQVAPFAFGPQFATIPYPMIVKQMSKEYAFALGIEHMMRDYPKWPLGAVSDDAAARPRAHDVGDSDDD